MRKRRKDEESLKVDGRPWEGEGDGEEERDTERERFRSKNNDQLEKVELWRR